MNGYAQSSGGAGSSRGTASEALRASVLVELRIRDFAIIDSLTLPFAAGLNVLTGETGAGKSIIVGALSVLVGERGSGDLVRTGLRVKKAGNAIVARLGGREIHPVNVKVGGFYRVPTRAEIEALLPEIEWASRAMRDLLPTLRALEFPDLERDYEFVA